MFASNNPRRYSDDVAPAQTQQARVNQVSVLNNDSVPVAPLAYKSSLKGFLLPFSELVERYSKCVIPAPVVLRCPETSSFNSGTNEHKRKRFKKLKKSYVSYVDFRERFINADGKYRFSEFEAVYSVNGMMSFISSNGDVPDLVVRCGPTEDTGEPVLLMKFGSQADSFLDDEDEDVNIVQPDFFVAKLVMDVDEDSCYTANISYFANDSRLSCNLASELPDANATGTLLEVFASMAAIMGTELIGDSEVNSYE